VISRPYHGDLNSAASRSPLFVFSLLLLCSAGPSKLPEVGKGLGKTFKSFQTAAKASFSSFQVLLNTPFFKIVVAVAD
jgi:hypothetical protein